MKDFLISWLIGIVFINGAYMPFDSVVEIILKIALYILGYWMIRYYGRNYWKWNDN